MHVEKSTLGEVFIYLSRAKVKRIIRLRESRAIGRDAFSKNHCRCTNTGNLDAKRRRRRHS